MAENSLTRSRGLVVCSDRASVGLVCVRCWKLYGSEIECLSSSVRYVSVNGT